MLSFQNPSLYQSSKCFVTYGIMGHVDPKQPPSKGKPWATLASQDFVHRVRQILLHSRLFTTIPSSLCAMGHGSLLILFPG